MEFIVNPNWNNKMKELNEGILKAQLPRRRQTPQKIYAW